MKAYRQLATFLGGLAILTAALLAQSTPAASTAVKPPPPPVPPVQMPNSPPVLEQANTPTPATMPPVEPAVPVPPDSTLTPSAPPVSTATAGSINVTGTGTGSRNPVVFSSLDTNGDGKISPEEYAAYVAQGSTGSAGLAVPPATPPVKRGFWHRMFHRDEKTVPTTSANTGAGVSVSSNPPFADLDTNHDGYLSQDELAARPNK